MIKFKLSDCFCRLTILIMSVVLFLFMAHPIYATHNRAGEISYSHSPTDSNPYRYEFLITTYTKSSSTNADRDSLTINWGDNTFDVIPRDNGAGSPPQGVDIGNDIKRNEYIASHNYSGPGEYLVWMQDPNRIEDILNINFGNSVNEPFYLENTLKILDPQFFAFNNSPILLQPPIDQGAVGSPFIHNPNAFDPDGDSLHFQLVPPKVSTQDDVPNYLYPDGVMPGPDNNWTLDPATGEFIWDSPQQEGTYNITFLITEWRGGTCIGTMIRDMQIFIFETENNPPVIAEINDTCIIAGDSIGLSVLATDEDFHSITFTALGGPFEVENNPATVSVFNDTLGVSEMSFSWNTLCEHILNQKYTVVFKAEDYNVSDPEHITLVDLFTWQIQVVPPPPEGLTAQLQAGGNVLLTWSEPYACSDIEKFRGFSVWRAQGCDSSEFDICDPNLAAYTKIASDIDIYTYTDMNASPGIVYSYIIVSEFYDISGGGSPLNKISSSPSNIACVEIPKTLPVITNVNILSTDVASGNISIAWSKPDPEELDTLIHTGPYKYVIERAEGFGSNFTFVDEFVSNSFAGANDTVFVDQNLNTSDLAYNYRIGFISGTEDLGYTDESSSVRLSISSSSEQLNLTWQEEVAWTNYSYEIWKQDPLTMNWDSIATVSGQAYVDLNLENGVEYCYAVHSIGTYNTSGIVDPLNNWSQEVCAIPVDTVPPCSPILSISNDCEEDIGIWGTENFVNLLEWERPIDICGDTDVMAYMIYFTAAGENQTTLISTINDPYETSFEHELDFTLAGCYTVAAIDSFDNVGTSAQVCIQNCPLYELPSVFTPNGDNENDLFIPRNSRFIESISIDIFNRWGNKVYTSVDPNINWDGTHYKSGSALSEGVYYYSCKVNQLGIVEAQSGVLLEGYIHLIRSE